MPWPRLSWLGFAYAMCSINTVGQAMRRGAAAWFVAASLVVSIWFGLARRWWQGGPGALLAASSVWLTGLLAALAATGIAWTGLLRSIFHRHLFEGPAPAAALLLMVGLPLFSCAAHLRWLRWRAG